MDIQDLDRLLPERILGKAIPHGTEFFIPYPEVLEAIDIATKNSIAVLGVEVFQVESDGFRVQEYSHYEIPYGDDWASFVSMNNELARAFVEEHRRGEEHAYILTSTSKQEFEHLR